LSGSGFYFPLHSVSLYEQAGRNLNAAMCKVRTSREPVDYSLPLYTPTTKKFPPQKINQIICEGGVNREITQEVQKWLTLESFYETLLRNIPLGHRTKWKNTCVEADVAQMLAAGIIQPASFSSPSKCFVKMQSVNETKKGRRRLILETRDINVAIRSAKEKYRLPVHLPNQKDIEECMANFPLVTSTDFRSFFYQIELGHQVRKFFRIILNGKLYELKVLPMGAVFSVFIAQTFASACAFKMEVGFRQTQIQRLVYIDNIFFFHDSPSPTCDWSVWDIPEIGDYEKNKTEIPILGKMVNLSDKSIALSPKTLTDLRNLDISNKITVRGFLRVWGLVVFALDTLHITLQKFFSQMETLRSVCSFFVSGRVHLLSRAPLSRKSVLELKALVLGVDWKERCIIPFFLPNARFDAIV
jgi:hypothetical protein